MAISEFHAALFEREAQQHAPWLAEEISNIKQCEGCGVSFDRRDGDWGYDGTRWHCGDCERKTRAWWLCHEEVVEETDPKYWYV